MVSRAAYKSRVDLDFLVRTAVFSAFCCSGFDIGGYGDEIETAHKRICLNRMEFPLAVLTGWNANLTLVALSLLNCYKMVPEFCNPAELIQYG